MADRYIVDLLVVEADMQRHRMEYRRLRRFLAAVRKHGVAEANGAPVVSRMVDAPLRVVDLKPKRKHKVEDALAERLRAFVRKQEDSFDHRSLKEAAGDGVKKHHLRGALKFLADEGSLKVIRSPNGRNPGEYRRGSVNAKAAEG